MFRTLHNLLSSYRARTKARMRSRIKFMGDFYYHYQRGNSFIEAWSLARRTL